MFDITHLRAIKADASRSAPDTGRVIVAAACALASADESIAVAQEALAAAGIVSPVEFVEARTEARRLVSVCADEAMRAHKTVRAEIGEELVKLAADVAEVLSDDAGRHEERAAAKLRLLCGDEYGALSRHHDLESFLRRTPAVSERRHLAERLRGASTMTCDELLAALNQAKALLLQG